MAELRLTKVALKESEAKLFQLQKYLPTLKLKKSLLQSEIDLAEQELAKRGEQERQANEGVTLIADLFVKGPLESLRQSVSVSRLDIGHDNIAGIDIPTCHAVIFEQPEILLIETPLWFEMARERLQEAITARWKSEFASEKVRRLREELRQVTIRVNLFEKVLIPKIQDEIKKIKIFLGDLMLGDIAKAKIAKKKLSQGAEDD